MSLIWHENLKDFADEDRRERLEYMQEQKATGIHLLLVWVLLIVVSAGVWGLALTVGRWLWRFIP